MLKRVEGRAQTYGDTITRARERQLRLTTRNVNRLMRTYNAAAASITQQISGLPAHMIGDANDAMRQVYLENILREIEATLTQFRTMFAGRLRGGMLEMAQAAVDREVRVQALGGTMRENDPLLARDMTEQVSLPNGDMASIEYGRVAHDAVEAMATRYYGDGLRLSDRLYDVDRTLRRGVEDTLMQAVVEGASIRETIDRLTAGPLSKTADAANRAAVIARTEIAHAYTEAHVRSVKDPQTGLWRDGVTGLKWSLSVSHPKPDICCRAGTVVLTHRGSVPIEEISIGDYVLTHAGQYKPVVRVYRHTIGAGLLTKLCRQSGHSRTPDLIVTPNHPVLTARGWIEAGDLRTGCDQVLCHAEPDALGGLPSSGSWETVTTERVWTLGEVVYNLGVEGDQSYMANGIAVHNCDVWAMHDEGRGDGVYYATPVPTDHPNGLCFTTTVLVAVPESANWSGGQVPDLDGIADAHVQYYADRGDTVAQRYMMSGG